MKRLFSIFLGITLLGGCETREQDGEPRLPNFVILFADDLGYGDVGVYGHPTIKTPNLDQLASEGMKLTQFYAAASICTPSRAGLLTGRLPIRNGMCGGRGVLFPDSDGGLPPSEITIAEALKTKGYASACVGKWHLGHLEQYLPTNQGFDYYFGIPYSNDMSPAQNDWEGAQSFPPTPLIEGTQVIEQEPDQSQLTRRYTEKALKFIDDHQEQPFFLYLPYTFPHVPLYVSDRFKDTSKRGLYGDVVEEIDWSVGEIMKALKAHGLEQNTLVIFTSDNGPWLVMDQEGGSAGLLREGKGTTWEGGMREPAIIKYPPLVESGTVSSAMASTLDLFPTIVSLAQAQLPNQSELDGVNLMPVLNQPEEQVREMMYYYRGDQLYALRKGPWKAHFISMENPYDGAKRVVSEHETPLLFNVEVDPSEKYNLSDQHPEIVDDLRSEKIMHEQNLVKMPCQLINRIRKTDQ
ncbi:MAG: sulfatase family protein [Candidatus Cyclobacteriaceae bacterium M3_2C_046]